ncbi:sugar phosphate permease [Bradyrhizobium japonicum]|jgi:sugar phosphate permease|uniref:MFS transporter n=1 Tax=Bradyrhizobium TaxID=374 RepID=UPI00036EB264|nr:MULTISPECIES: MFS transporter [Bradyrhizobium]MBP2427267.1 sugar phosphate permease [Bradyrhizobium elkanii]MCP1730488.1 sugar phosphate permease [Bradyrhizobium elkanii]MCP1930951.1 sugar phosphate permease [Bradyrhizobium elkanii]MCP1970467.1 sugar phosphate permease [Bradyrhizobium elkanii]MCS3480831.1 sugar phosphate permease [Bradyrhizobium elkanii]
MISNWLASTLARRNIHYGWVMVAVTFLAALISAGTVGAPGVFIVPLQKEFGWSTAEISSALSIRFILFGLMAPFAAALMNRYGLRNVTLAAQLIVVSGLLASLAMTQVWQLILLWGVVIGIGTGMTALVLGATIAARWFVARRGLVVGILTASVATGQLAFLPLLATLTERYGWRVALGLVCVMLAVAAFAVLMVMRDRPSDVGLRPFGDEGTAPLPAPPPANAPIVAAALGTLRDSAKSSVFWILFATFFVCGASTNGLVQVHLIPMCLDYGIPQVQAASLLAAMGIFDFFGTIVSGWLSDRYDNRYLLFWYYGLRGLSLLFLPFSDFTFYGLSLFAMFYGLDWIATVPPTVRLTAQRFGAERANLVFGWIFAGHQLGAGAAAFGAGLSRTIYQSYLPAFFIAGALCIFAALTALAIARPQPKSVAEPKPVAA